MDLLSHPSPLNAILSALACGPHRFKMHHTKLRRGLTILAQGSMQMFLMWEVCPCHNDFSEPGCGSQRLAVSDSPHQEKSRPRLWDELSQPSPLSTILSALARGMHGFKTHRTKLRKGLTILALGFGQMFPMWGVCLCSMSLSQQLFQASLGGFSPITDLSVLKIQFYNCRRNSLQIFFSLPANRVQDQLFCCCDFPKKRSKKEPCFKMYRNQVLLFFQGSTGSLN